MDRKAKATIAVSLLEAACHLMAQATTEAPGLGIGPRIADINRRLHALQQELLKIVDGNAETVGGECG